VVIDHIGRIDAALGIDQQDFQALLKLMADERFWVKVSGMDRITRLGPPFADAQPFARMLVAEFGDRVVWGNDWPHPNHAGPMPDEQQLVDLIAEIAPTEFARQALLVRNPERLYQFGDNT
jgi:2-pyrone-4,6-dicarboxylate lactonase